MHRLCRELQELQDLMLAQGMPMEDMQRAAFLLTASDEQRLQEALANAQAVREGQTTNFEAVLVEGGAVGPCGLSSGASTCDFEGRSVAAMSCIPKAHP